MSTIELTAKVRGLKALQLLIEEAQAEAETIKDAIKAEMTAREVDEMQVDVFKIRWREVTTNRFDTTAFKTKYSDLYNQFTTPTTTRRFSVA